VKVWLKRGLGCLTITFAVCALGLWLMAKACNRICPDREVQRLQSPDGRHIVTHILGDPCGGATVDFTHEVRLSRRDGKDSIVLLETYHSPKGIEIRWTDSFHVEVLGNGMDQVRVLRRYDKLQWSDISIRILLDNEVSQ
jgi:hypothetical protein